MGTRTQQRRAHAHDYDSFRVRSVFHLPSFSHQPYVRADHGSFDYRRWAIAWKLMNWELESLYDYFFRAYESVFWISYHTYLPKISALLTFS